jgi:hypothetical protein
VVVDGGASTFLDELPHAPITSVMTTTAMTLDVIPR